MKLREKDEKEISWNAYIAEDNEDDETSDYAKCSAMAFSKRFGYRPYSEWIDDARTVLTKNDRLERWKELGKSPYDICLRTANLMRRAQLTRLFMKSEALIAPKQPPKTPVPESNHDSGRNEEEVLKTTEPDKPSKADEYAQQLRAVINALQTFPDELLPFAMVYSLEYLKQRAEATEEYQKIYNSMTHAERIQAQRQYQRRFRYYYTEKDQRNVNSRR